MKNPKEINKNGVLRKSSDRSFLKSRKNFNYKQYHSNKNFQELSISSRNDLSIFNIEKEKNFKITDKKISQKFPKNDLN